MLGMFTGRFTAVVLLILGVAVVETVWAQDEPAPTVVARFEEATALSIDPTGRLYVADAGADVVRIMGRDGTERAVLGGAGTRAGQFDRPADVDPTNGQTLWVADAGNGRVQRFSEEGLYLEALPVGPAFREGRDQRALDDGRDGATVRGAGRPVAVASTSGDETFVLDGREDAVLKWDDQRRPERVLGARGRPGRTLERPVALALDGTRRLYVADQAAGAVFAFDLFGSLMKRLPISHLPDLRALTIHRKRLWIVCSGRVYVWAPRRGVTTVHEVDLSAPLVDAARRGDDVFLLTERHLYRRPSW